MKNVSLGEALQNRKHVLARVTKLAAEMQQDAFGYLRQDRATGIVMQPEPPEHDTNYYVAAIGSAVAESAALVSAIDLANARVVIEYQGETMTLTEALVLRQRWTEAAALVEGALPSKDANRVIFADTHKMRELANTFARQAREIDVVIQQANWSNTIGSPETA